MSELTVTGFSELDLRVLDAPNLFKILNPCMMWWTDGDTLRSHTVKRGRRTDLASIPWPLRWLFNRNGPSRKPAVFHDDMYRQRLHTRKYCDQVFRAALIARGVSKWKAQTYYLGVRAGGWTRGSW